MPKCPSIRLHNSIFVFVPDDIYIVNAKTATSTVTIKFLKSFFRNTNSQPAVLPVNDWFRKIEEILNSESHQLREMKFENASDKLLRPKFGRNTHRLPAWNFCCTRT